jgi:hypothetical protein
MVILMERQAQEVLEQEVEDLGHLSQLFRI